MKNLIYSLAALAVVGLVGCGGGGASSAPVASGTEAPEVVTEVPKVVL